MLRSMLLLLAAASLAGQTPDWKAVEAETLRHFQALVRFDTTDPPGNETGAAAYLKEVLEKEGIEVKVYEVTKNRPNVIARLKGTGKKRPLLIMGHTDTVNIDPAKWKHPPFGAVRDGGYIYGRGTVDDKDNVVACLMTMLLLKRQNVALDRDVIFLAEAGEEGSTRVGIQFVVGKYWPEIEAEYCIAEGASVVRTGGKLRYVGVMTTEKIPYRATLISRGPAGHGSRPLQNNALVHLSQAVAKAANWRPPMKLNDTTRTYFEKLANISEPADAARYKSLVDPEKTESIQDYLAANEPAHYSMLRTSVSPTMIKAGYRMNVIPSEGEATLDIRLAPGENGPEVLDELRKVINDPQVEVVRAVSDSRPSAPPSALNNAAFQAIEAAAAATYGSSVPTIPVMSTGATDMAYLRAKGVQCYGVGPMIDTEDGPQGYGAHSDQERILEESLYQFVKFHHHAVVNLAKAQ